MEERSIEDLMDRLSDPAKRPAMSDMRGLSDLSSAERRTFWAIWQAVPVERRHQLATAMQELAEENSDLDFREVFLCCLNDDDLLVRVTAIQGLWEDDRLSTMRRLIDLLQHDPTQEVRAAAAIGLGHFSNRAGLEEIDDSNAQRLLEALLAAFFFELLHVFFSGHD